eukprot:12145270-Alexandrium_andersonii.AAC.1
MATPDAGGGGYWERRCEEHLKGVGFVPVEEWKFCFVHEKHGLFLVVYVDDFKMAGPTENLAKGWELIRHSRVSAEGEKKPGLTMDDPTPFG